MNSQVLRIEWNPTSNGVVLPLKSPETASWSVMIEFNGTWIRLSLEVTQGEDIVIPNILNERYCHRIRLLVQGKDVFNNTEYTLIHKDIEDLVDSSLFLSTPVEDKVEVSAEEAAAELYPLLSVEQIAGMFNIPVHEVYGREVKQHNDPIQNCRDAFIAGANWALSHPTPAPVKEGKALSDISYEDAIEVAKILIEKYNAYDFSCVLLNVDEKFKTLELVPNDYYKNLKMATKQIDFRLNCDIVMWKMHAKSPWSMHDSDEIENYPLPQYLKSIDFLRSRGYDIPNSYTL